jgi:hypothetical protein
MRLPNFVAATCTFRQVNWLFALSAGLVLLLASAGGAQTPPSAAALTEDLVALGLKYRLAAPADLPQVSSQILRAALRREQLLSGLMETDPAEVLRLAVPAGLRAGLPPQVQAHIEEHVEVEGTLEVLYEDYADGTNRSVYFLDTASGRLSLHFVATAPDLLTGTRARVRGVRLGGFLALDSGMSVQTLSQVVPSAFGSQKTLVILVNFQDKATQPYTPEFARGVVFNSTSAFDLENSFGQTSLTGDVTNWYTIALSSTVCDSTTLATLAKQAASANFDVSSYPRLVYAFPQNACSWWGLGSVGGNPSQAWINGSFALKVVGHEMGHNFGLYHSHSLDCGSVVLGGTCTASAYGDTIDIMGNPSSGHFTAFQKERLGWLGYGVSPTITTVLGDGVYTLEPYEAQTAGTKALKILQATDASTGTRTWYYVEYRQAIGFDAFLSSYANVINGVVIHQGSESSADSSYLLDLTPATSSWNDPALDVGQSFYDPNAGVTITPISAGTWGASVNVAFGSIACVRGTQTVTASPASTQWTSAGSMVSYVVSVTNNDNGGCSASTFSLQASVPTGWTAAFGASALSIAPGTSASTTMQVTSPPSAADGLYSVPVTSTNAAAPTYTASATVSQMLAGAIQVRVSTNQPSYARNTSVTASALVTTTDSLPGETAPVQGASVSFSITAPNNRTVTGTATTGANGVASFQYRISKKDPTGQWQVKAVAAVNGITGAGSTTFTVVK